MINSFSNKAKSRCRLFLPSSRFISADLEKLKFLDNIDGLIQDVYNAAKKQFAGLLDN